MNGIEELVSIIVPIYNAENYLSRCLESVKKQTYKNIEVLLVNDGSTDKSKEICETYRNLDHRMVVINKENGGLSDARNCGINKSHGHFLFFLDSDDYIDNDCIEKLLESVIKNNCDVAISDGIYEKDGREIPYKNNALLNGEIITTPKEIFEIFLEHKGLPGSPWVAWGKLFRRSLFDDIAFPVGKVSEDIATIPDVLIRANKIVYISEKTYHYVLREGSLIHQRSEKMIVDNHCYLKKLKDLVNKEYPNLQELMTIEYVWVLLMIGIMPQCKKTNILDDVLIDIRNEKKAFLRSDKPIKYRMLLIAFSLFPKTTKKMLELR